MSRSSALALALLALSACGGDDTNGPTKGARILKFSASPQKVRAGQASVLSWETSGTNGVAIEPGIGIKPPTGEVEVRPLVTTTYTLVVIVAGGDNLESRVTVEVEGGPPRVDAFTATPRSIQAGERSRLEWATSNASMATINPGVGTVPTTGSAEVSPTADTTYVLSATGTDGTATAEVTIRVVSGNQPVVESFTATPQTISPGDRATLTWQTRNTTNVTISGVPGQFGSTGSVEVSPTATSVFTLDAVGPGGASRASVTVTVIAASAPKILFFLATPDTVASGGLSELSWNTDNAREVVIEPGIGSQMAKGTYQVHPTQTTTYTLRAIGDSGAEASGQVTVTVAAPNSPVITGFTATPQAIRTGANTTLAWTTQNATSVQIDPGLGSSLPANGSVQATPQQTTTYTLTARGTSGEVTQQLTVTVTAPPPTVGRFVATPASVNAGQAATLEWTTTDAAGVEIDSGIGMKPANGSVTVTPAATTQYNLTATGPGGSTTAQVTVTVSAVGAPTVDFFRSTPPQIAPNGTATLEWSATGATRVTIDRGIGEKPTTGSVTVNPSVTTSYTLTAEGPGGTATAQVTVTVRSTSGDQCSDAIEITASGTFTGNTLSAVNDYSAARVCTRFDQTGPDVVYRVRLQASDRLVATLSPAGQPSWDTSIYLVTSCGDVSSSCVAGEDNGNPEVVDYTAAAAGEYFIVVDGYNGAGGPYELVVDINSAPVGNDRCEGAIDATAGGTFAGDTSPATADYTPSAAGCTQYAERGKDVTYSVALAAGERLRASLDAPWDAALYVVSNCASIDTTCGAGSDAGNPEAVDFSAPSAGTYFLIVDGYEASAGSYELTVSISPPVTGGETCGDAVPVPDSGGSFQSTTQGRSDDYNPDISCTGSAAAGPDQVYRADLRAGEVVEVIASFDAALDGSLYVLDDCNAASCRGTDYGFAGESEYFRFVARGARPHYVVVDAAVAGWSGGHDLTINRYPAETCADAAPLAFDSGPEWFTTDGTANDYSPNSGGCTGFTASAGDRVYEIYLFSGEQLQVTVVPETPTFDVSTYLVSSCADITGSCVQGADAAQSGGTERLLAVVQTTGMYDLILDGFLGSTGSGTMDARIVRGDTCDDAYQVPPNGGTFDSTTSGYGAELGTETPTGSCTSWEQAGPDAVYALTIPAGRTLRATLNSSWDASLYLVSDCAQSATSCVAGRDGGNPEELTYANPGASDSSYFLIVDSWRVGANDSGNYSLTITYE
ncbi:MAG: hypothetical protein HYV07_29300 [Deltaproteobacteria bacterium]|nr:hypothetical protein [Deltaproteobacteria bacterium]